MNDKYDVERKLNEAAECLKNRIRRIRRTKKFAFGKSNFDFLIKTIQLYDPSSVYFGEYDYKHHSSIIKCFRDALQRIDFGLATNDEKLRPWVEELGFPKIKASGAETVLKNLNDSDACFSNVYSYLIRMILIERKAYSKEEYERDLKRIYIIAPRNADYIPVIRYSIIEEKCSWGKDERDYFHLSMSLDSEYSANLLKEIFE